MGLQLPGELITALGWIGYTWPEADEVKLFEMGQAWIEFAGRIGTAAGEADAAAAQVWTQNVGPAVAAFQKWWGGEQNGPLVLHDSMPAAVLLGAGLIICAAIVLALKIAVIVQLAILAFEVAQAIATAVVTFGASLAEIPVFQVITREIVGALIDQVVNRLLDA
ncbi:WXG100-like domain-containing protein [Micromonospora maritima]|uniref:Outer membrane channel protein CpnT-like N-terminal domain-containing protein n=1 Tax=Micromonospora maritima TaxID=986711 RepID=A0ABW7ZIN2_9ACTN